WTPITPLTGSLLHADPQLYSDAWFVAEAYNLGPYSFLNTLPATRAGRMYDLKPGIVLRAEWLLVHEARVAMETDDDHYHGGSAFDEMASLASLVLDARIVAGPIDRTFTTGEDPLGRPRGHDTTLLPLLSTAIQRPQIPRLQGQRDLRELSEIVSYPSLPADGAAALVKSARLFQNALWIADSAPETAWLLLVSAIETAANHWDSDSRTPEERLALSYVSLINILRKAGVENIIPKVARTLKGVIGAESKFIGFMEAFMPPEPVERPTFGKVDFGAEAMLASIKRIYRLRSRALHSGIPFPAPMCLSPERYDDGPFQESPLGLATTTLGASWKAEDTPMLLHVFAYLTRGALLNWWRGMPKSGIEPEDLAFCDRLTDFRSLAERFSGLDKDCVQSSQRGTGN
ncbi:MAG: hypothetical protein ACOYLK_17545, partial [Sphingomonas sp.]